MLLSRGVPSSSHTDFLCLRLRSEKGQQQFLRKEYLRANRSLHKIQKNDKSATFKDYILVMWKIYYIKNNPPSFDICTYEIRLLLETAGGRGKQTNKKTHKVRQSTRRAPHTEFTDLCMLTIPPQGTKVSKWKEEPIQQEGRSISGTAAIACKLRSRLTPQGHCRAHCKRSN